MSPLTLPRQHAPADPDTGIPETLDDLAALRRYARTGDPRAFELVAARYESMVLATCRRVLKNHADAEDAAQQSFIKLASHAGRVRSNAAAWLHACALRTATDIARSAASRRKHEHDAAETADTQGHPQAAADHPRTPDWHELEHKLDRALAKLDDADRDLICARFLAGRSQAHLARDAGVNPGTLHRRLNKALDRLRARLSEAGVSLSAVALAGGLAAIHAAAPAPGAALQTTLAKIGLAGMANATATAASTISAKPVVAAVAGLALIAGIVAGGAMILNRGAGSSTAVAILTADTDQPKAPSRPKRRSDPLHVTGLTDPVWLGPETIIEGDTLRYAFPMFAPDGQTQQQRSVTLSIPGASDLRLRPNKPVTLNATVTATDLPQDAGWNINPGDPLALEARIDRLGRLHLSPSFGLTGEDLIERFVGARPIHRDAQDFPVPSDPQSIAGAWFAVQDWALVLDKDDLTLTDGDWAVHRFRIIDWTDAGDHARISAIAADSMDPRLIGKRLKLLLKQQGNTYTLAYHYHASTLLDQWPAGFTPGQRRNVQVLAFSKGKP